MSVPPNYTSPSWPALSPDLSEAPTLFYAYGNLREGLWKDMWYFITIWTTVLSASIHSLAFFWAYFVFFKHPWSFMFPIVGVSVGALTGFAGGCLIGTNVFTVNFRRIHSSDFPVRRNDLVNLDSIRMGSALPVRVSNRFHAVLVSDHINITLLMSGIPLEAPAVEQAAAKPSTPTEDPEEILFHQLESEFKNTLQLIDGDSSLIKFKDEYQKLFNTFAKSHESERRLAKKCQELQTEIMGQANQVQNVMKINQTDRSVISSLKKDIKKAMEMIDESKEREEKTKETISQLKAEISVLESTIQQTEEAGANQEQALNDLSRQKEELTRERDMQVNQIIQLRSEVGELSEKIRHLEMEKAEADQQISSLKEIISTKKADAEKELRTRERLERELKETKSIVEQKTTEIHLKQEFISKAKDESGRLEAQIRDQKILIEKAVKEQEQLQLKVSKLQQDYEEQIQTTSHLIADNQKKAAELAQNEEDITAMKSEIKSLAKQKEQLSKKQKMLEEARASVETERDQLKAVNKSLERDLESAKHELDQERRHLDELTRERDIIFKNLQKSSSATQKQVALVKIQEQTKKNLEQDINMYREEATKQRKIIYQLEKERDKHISETAQAQAQYLEAIDNLKLKENEIYECKKKIYEVENKLKQQQNLYEAVRADRNLYSKNLIDTQEELGDLKRKIALLTHQVEQLKEDIRSKDAQLNKETQELGKIEKERDALRQDIQKLKSQNELAEQYFQNQQIEQHKLRAIVHEAEAERGKQKKEYEAVVQERDSISAQLVRRNDELATLYEKLKVQQSILAKGESQYKDRLEEIKLLNLEISRLRQDNMLYQKETVGIDKMKGAIVNLEKNVQREKTRVKALEEQLQSPINVHRWRRLEGTDPEMFELIRKVQSLQKRLIAKSEEVVEKELVIQQKEKIYEEVKKVLAKQPGPEVIEKVNVYQQMLKSKTSQLKAMASELSMCQNQVQDYQDEIHRLTTEINGMKKTLQRSGKPKKKALGNQAPQDSLSLALDGK